ncbi:UPF0481 protein [Acorus calamus]|uniref:UPF0481 protein n=1 Tax=Acorus calamus TaxID=4465 RepID=A0AAV9D2V6_ACOCL|nr:UPF0481 protein [Acorus calamus]
MVEGNASEPSIVLDYWEKQNVAALRRGMNRFSLEEGRSREYCSIFKIPQKFRVLDPDAYEPSVVSIGPYHANKQRLRVMETNKLRMAHRFLSRHNENMLEECIVKMTALEERVQSCYLGKICMNRYNLARMMFLDGCFILSVLHRQKSEVEKLNKILDGISHQGTEGDGGIGDDLFNAANASENRVEKRIDDALMKMFREIMEDIRQDDYLVWTAREGEEELEMSRVQNWLCSLGLLHLDLLKVENQIPFFVVEILFDLLLLPEDKNVPLIDLVTHLLNKIHRSQCYVRIRNPNVNHLLHLFHVMLVPNPSTRKPAPAPPPGWLLRLKKSATAKLRPVSRGAQNILPCFHEESEHPQQQAWRSRTSYLMLSATELKEAGVVFKQKPNSNFLDITFDKGVMEIPALCIYDHTFLILRNLIAYEQYYPNTGNHVTYYAVFMESMMKKPEDVKALQSKGILRTGKRDDVKVVRLYNGLCEGVIIDRNRSYLKDLFYQVNQLRIEMEQAETEKDREER